MKLISVLKRVVPFLLGLAIGVTAGRLAGNVSETSELENLVAPVVVSGLSSGFDRNSCRTTKSKVFDESSKLTIMSKPRPGYTDEARLNNVDGTVILRITFLASGEIGDIEPVKTLPNGLTEQAIAAARRIEFKPAVRHGMPVSVTKQIEYSFSIY